MEWKPGDKLSVKMKKLFGLKQHFCKNKCVFFFGIFTVVEGLADYFPYLI